MIMRAMQNFGLVDKLGQFTQMYLEQLKSVSNEFDDKGQLKPR